MDKLRINEQREQLSNFNQERNKQAIDHVQSKRTPKDENEFIMRFSGAANYLIK
jgi:hypothetical protein